MTFLTDSIELIFGFINLGGPVVAILMLLSVVSLAVIVMKLWEFSRLHVGRRNRAENAVRLWIENRPTEALALARAGRSPAAQGVARAIALISGGQRDKADIEERLSRSAVGQLHALQSGFRLLDAVAQIAPLLGLFGTVLGMIDAFRKLQTAGSVVDPTILAGGIWVALLTTAAGLAVAMPVSLVLTWLESRVENERVAIETLTSDILAPAGIIAEAESVSSVPEGLSLAS
ncbi:MotA/TolQ/ExbB proton channel family protein [Hoeflea sp. Naph1]|uniref:MotA/TolQ/ExbB proton channel family protein n=1 Tax=Hoeflea sp. Naph1 TaxID=3388653 RepID=UPI00398FC20E